MSAATTIDLVAVRQLLTLGAVFGVAVVVLAGAPVLPVALLVLLVVGGSSIAFRSVAMSWSQLHSLPQMRGRVMSLLVVATAGTTPIGAPLVGWLAETFGARVATGIGGVATIAAVLATLVYLNRSGILDLSHPAAERADYVRAANRKKAMPTATNVDLSGI